MFLFLLNFYPSPVCFVDVFSLIFYGGDDLVIRATIFVGFVDVSILSFVGHF